MQAPQTDRKFPVTSHGKFCFLYLVTGWVFNVFLNYDFLPSQGDDDEWRLHWRHLGLNPFSPDCTPLATSPTTSTEKPKPKKTLDASNPSPAASHPNTDTNQLKISVGLSTLPPLPGLVEAVTT